MKINTLVKSCQHWTHLVTTAVVKISFLGCKIKYHMSGSSLRQPKSSTATYNLRDDCDRQLTHALDSTCKDLYSTLILSSHYISVYRERRIQICCGTLKRGSIIRCYGLNCKYLMEITGSSPGKR